jgi:hypothetical protein
MSTELTVKQQDFVRHYLVCLNATEAARRAQYAENSAHVEGSRLLTNPKVQAAVAEAMRERAESLRVDQAWVLERLIAAAVNQNSPPATQVRAAELVGRHLGMFVDKFDVNHLAGMPLAQLREEARRCGIPVGGGDGPE